MREIKFTFKGLLSEIKLVLDYIAGKNASDANAYLRLTVCDADNEMLKKLIVESAAFLTSAAGKTFARFSSFDDDLVLTLSDSAVLQTEDSQEGLRFLTADFIIKHVVEKWLKLTGFKGGDLLAPDYAAIADNIKLKYGRGSKLVPRCFPPL